MPERQRLRGRQPDLVGAQRAGGVVAFAEKGADIIAGHADVGVPVQIVAVGRGKAAADGKARMKMIERLGGTARSLRNVPSR